MYQDFDEEDRGGSTRARVSALRRALKARNLNGFLVPHGDEHSAGPEWLSWLTGFTGSAGTAIVLEAGAALFVDGRYTLQARDQAEASLFEVLVTPEAKVSQWIVTKLPKGSVLGYDPKLHTVREIERLNETVGKAGITLEVVAANPIDRLWKKRPAALSGPIVPHGMEFAGERPEDKIAKLQATLVADKADALLLTQLDSIAWLFNIRGGDVRHAPVPDGFAIVPAKGRPTLFVDPAKAGSNVRGHLEDFVDIAPPSAREAKFAELGQAGASVRLDPETAPIRFAHALKEAGAKIVPGSDPCTLPKAIKNATEIAGAHSAHLRDGMALARFLAWLDDHVGSGRLDEVSAAMKLEAFRRETGQLKDISFDTISAVGPNGAIVHYRPTNKGKLPLKGNTLYLIDSGGQYPDGTTDVTRTIAIGSPTKEMRHHYTLVLKGHIAIASARFPKGTRGQDLDPLARQPLWQEGLDYDHGTGHGVGSYLYVHEGPQRLSKLGSVVLEPGMVLSNEPGLYREGEYGIRLENLVLVTPPAPIEGGSREMLGFETLTLVPFDRRLIDASMLTREEKGWLDAYHADVRRKIEPLLKSDDRPWLRHATAPIR
jgi:Xaa-Pro aminopeptidase